MDLLGKRLQERKPEKETGAALLSYLKKMMDV